MIKFLDLKKISLDLIEPYTIAYQSVSVAENVFIKLALDKLTGIGVCAPEEEVTKETPDSALKILSEQITPYLITISKFDSLNFIIDSLSERFSNYPAALASIDFALHSIFAQSKGIDIPKLYKSTSSDKEKITSITINILDIENTLKKAHHWLKLGFKVLKIKGGLNIEEDIRKLFYLKQKLPSLPPIIFDINQGYSFDEAKYFLKETKSLELVCIEQPVNKINTDELILLANMNITPIMADESACSLKDVEFLAKSGVQYFNIKLMKCGGIKTGYELISTALKCNKKVIISCMDECALSNCYSLLLANVFKEINLVDLDSFTDYKNDPTRDCINLAAGNISVNHVSPKLF